MANVLVDSLSLTAIANAIRSKLGVQTTYKPSEMAGAIDSISGGITPTGTKSITANGTYDVAEFASAEVAVPSSGITPTGTKQISVTENGTVTEDVTNYANAEITVNVSGSSEISWDDIASNSIPSGEIVLSGTSVGAYAFAYRSGTNSWKVRGNNVTYLNQNSFRESKYLTEAKFPALTSQHATGYGFYGCTRLAIVDWGLCNIPNNTFVNCSALNTLILRKTTGIQTCASASVFNGTPFKSGGTGGTIYIPEVLYNHLGDGTALDYKAAANWSTYDGYGTITWAKLEGSEYE